MPSLERASHVPMQLCTRVLHFVARVGARITGNQLEWEESLSDDSLLSDR